MDIARRFLDYAEAFETSYLDDNWSRLEDYFTEDAVYAGEPHAEGRNAVLQKLQTAVHEFDQKMDCRILELETPQVDNNIVSTAWTITYTKAGVPDLTISGTEKATFDGERIVYLEDILESEALATFQRWMGEHGSQI